MECNFIDEAIKNEKEFGLHAEQQLSELLQTIQPKISSEVSLQDKKTIVAENNFKQQNIYLGSKKILMYEIALSEINIHTILTNKHESIKHNFKLN